MVETQESALMVVGEMTAIQIFAPGVIDRVLGRIKEEVRSIETDISTDAGRKRVASLAYKVSRTKTFIEEQRKALVSDEKKRLAAIDAEGKRVRDELDTLRDEVRLPLTTWENAENSRIATHEQGIASIERMSHFDHTPSTEELVTRLQDIVAISTDGFQEFQKRAEAAKRGAACIIESRIESSRLADQARAAHEAREKAEAERARIAHDERVAREAREKAEREAQERAQQVAREAEAKLQQIEREARERDELAKREIELAEARVKQAEQNRIAAERKAEREAEAAAIRAEESKQAAIRAEREALERARLAEEEAQRKREANRSHRAKINREALAALVSGGIDETTAKKVIELVATNSIPNITISY